MFLLNIYSKSWTLWDCSNIIEAMYMKCPVITVNSGGPLETVQNGVTGFLCNTDAKSFALAMKKFWKNPSLRECDQEVLF